MSQYAVSAKDQVKGIYDPNQAELNRQTQELALLQSFNEQKLMTEEEYQQRKQAIIERYKNEQWQKEMNSYTQGLNDLGGAFDTLAGVVERSAGKQSTAYKGMFALSKGFAIAEASIKLSQAIAQALADPTALTPAQKFANMASVTVVNNGTPVESQVSTKQNGNELQVTIELIERVANGVYSKRQAQDMRSGGVLRRQSLT